MALIQHFTKEPPAAFELKGRMITLSVLRVLTSDLDVFADQLDARVAAAPDLFHNFPVLLDFESLPADDQTAFDIARLDMLLRARGFVPVGIRGAGGILAGIAAGVGIGVISETATAETVRRRASRETAAPARSVTMLVKEPVRSGQQIYAKGGDLIVLATVSPGAEILADGNIHIYGALRGRALAGVRGNTAARIFCRMLDAELISIAGHYQISEQIRDSERSQPVQIYLKGDSLVFETL
ncbi:MAG: septum site-determining protein MinC [Sulfurifustaceae bacterium]